MPPREQIHLPGPSPWPPLVGLGVLVLGAGIALVELPLLGAGGVIFLIGLLGWMYDEIRGPRSEEAPADQRRADTDR